ncbi:HTH-type transcriptional activator RhaR [Dyadobacter sp. CECT 9623]|uniref:HTH-type transcriptional activator RhaR n=1 Tax=Dyadobacter linearis TaxID=2823330 RepID=A0ABN7RFL7_9BACT|nr:AraC family transcriptional regulator [Dyadobacter sp. CECT 9623]CAG5072352.1 HTH-type transcriptional activator RhaR [Dyadobacter sp. CECT 9623]
MKVVFKSEDFAELNHVREFDEGFEVRDKSQIREVREEFNHEGMNARTHRIYCPGMIVSMIEGSLEKDLVHLLESDFPYLQMHFELSSTGCLYHPQARAEIDTVIYNGSHSLLFYPSLKGRLNYLKKPLSQSVEIELSLDFLRRIFNNDLEVLEEFGRNIEKNHPAIMGGKSFPITSAMRQILGQIRDCQFSGQLKRLFVEAKVIELLTIQISQINAIEDKRKVLKKTDVDKLHEIKELLLRNMYDPFSIEELSRLAGINRTKLQEGFRQLFGTTIFGYITDSRLDEAHKLLAENKFGATIAEISAISGYKNPQHFTAAFKRKFGYLPKDLRK